MPGDVEVTFAAADGWPLRGQLRMPEPTGDASAGAVMVPGSRHERDAWTATADALAGMGVASLRFDVRGRGASRGPRTYARMAPAERRRVALDVAAAIRSLSDVDGVDAGRIAVVAEQDTSADAVAAVAAPTTGSVQAIALLSPRHEDRIDAAFSRMAIPVLGLVSVEDRDGLRATVAAYLAGAADGSRLEVFHGLGIGITMASVRAFEHADAEPIEQLVAGWLAERLGGRQGVAPPGG